MEKLSTKQAFSLAKAMLGSNEFFITVYAQKVLQRSPNLVSPPRNHRYVVLSIGRDLGGESIYGYGNLCQAVTDAGYICLTSHRELLAYILEHWDELKAAKFKLLLSSAPSIDSGSWQNHVYAYLHKSYLRLNGGDSAAVYNVRTEVLALTTVKNS